MKFEYIFYSYFLFTVVLGAPVPKPDDSVAVSVESDVSTTDYEKEQPDNTSLKTEINEDENDYNNEDYDYAAEEDSEDTTTIESAAFDNHRNRKPVFDFNRASFDLKGRSQNRWDYIYTCTNGRLKFGLGFGCTTRFRGSLYNGRLYGKTFRHGFQPVGWTNGYFLTIGGHNTLQFYSRWYNGYRSIYSPRVKYYIDQNGYIYRGLWYGCFTCKPIEFFY